MTKPGTNIRNPYMVKMLLMCVLGLSLSSCLESSPPVLDMNDLAILEGVEGLYRLEEKGKSGGMGEVFLQIQPLPDRRYLIIWQEVHSAKPPKKSLQFNAAFIPLGTSQLGTENYLGTLNTADVKPGETFTFYLTVEKKNDVFSFELIDFDENSQAAPAAKRSLAKKGVEIDPKGSTTEMKGQLTSRVLKEVFSDPEFLAVLRHEGYTFLHRVSKEDQARVAALFPPIKTTRQPQPGQLPQ